MNLAIDLFDKFHNNIDHATVPLLAKISDHNGTREEIQSVQETLECAEEFAIGFLQEIGGDHALIYDQQGIPLAYVDAHGYSKED